MERQFSNWDENGLENLTGMYLGKAVWQTPSKPTVVQNPDGSWSPLTKPMVRFSLQLTPGDRIFLKACGIAIDKD